MRGLLRSAAGLVAIAAAVFGVVYGLAAVGLRGAAWSVLVGGLMLAWIWSHRRRGNRAVGFLAVVCAAAFGLWILSDLRGGQEGLALFLAGLAVLFIGTRHLRHTWPWP